MQIKNAYVMEPDFIPAFDELLKKPMPAKQCLEMITSSEIITTEYNRLMKAQLLILDQYCVKNEDGTLKFDDKGNVIFEDGTLKFDDKGNVNLKEKTSEATCNKEIIDLKSGTTEIPLINKVKIYDDDLTTPRKVFLLKDLIEIVERPSEPPKK